MIVYRLGILGLGFQNPAREISRDFFSNGLEKDGVVDNVSKKPKSDLED